MKILIVSGEWELYQVRCWILPYCWYFNAGPNFKADMRSDGLIYVSGFKTRERAEAWACGKGLI